MTLERRSQRTQHSQEITKAMKILYDTLKDHCTFTGFAGEFFTVFKIAAIKFSYKAIPSLESSITFSFLISLLWETFRDRAPKERKIPTPFAREIAPAVFTAWAVRWQTRRRKLSRMEIALMEVWVNEFQGSDEDFCQVWVLRGWKIVTKIALQKI